MYQRGRMLKVRLALDLLPLLDQRGDLTLERLLRDVFADGAHDDSAGIRWEHRLHLLAQPLTLGALADFPAHAHARGEGHVHDEAPGERYLRRDAWTLRGDGLLGHLDDDVLAALQHVLNLRCFRTTAARRGAPAPRRRRTRRPHHRRRRLRRTRDRTRAGTRSSRFRSGRTRPGFQAVPLRPFPDRCPRPCVCCRGGRSSVRRAGHPPELLRASLVEPR